MRKANDRWLVVKPEWPWGGQRSRKRRERNSSSCYRWSVLKHAFATPWTLFSLSLSQRKLPFRGNFSPTCTFSILGKNPSYPWIFLRFTSSLPLRFRLRRRLLFSSLVLENRSWVRITWVRRTKVDVFVSAFFLFSRLLPIIWVLFLVYRKRTVNLPEGLRRILNNLLEFKSWERKEDKERERIEYKREGRAGRESGDFGSLEELRSGRLMFDLGPLPMRPSDTLFGGR